MKTNLILKGKDAGDSAHFLHASLVSGPRSLCGDLVVRACQVYPSWQLGYV